MRQNFFSWENHNIDDFDDSRLFPRLYIASCIFNTQNRQCVKPLHLLMTDMAHTFKSSSSSSDFWNLLEKISAGISKRFLEKVYCKQEYANQ